MFKKCARQKLLVAAGLMFAATNVLAQYTDKPFWENPIEIAQSASLALISAQARALMLATAEWQVGAKAIEANMARVSATLASTQPDVAENLTSVIGSLVDAEYEYAARSAAQAVTSVASEVAKDFHKEYWSLDTTEGRAREAAVISKLLLSEGGLTEAFAVVVESKTKTDYALAFSILQLIKIRTTRLEQALGTSESAQTNNTTDEKTELLRRLDALMPTPAVPASFGDTPEGVEGIAEALIVVLEREVGADLHPGRDPNTASGVVLDLAMRGCGPIDHSQQAALNQELIAISASYYKNTLEAALPESLIDSGDKVKEAYARILDAGVPDESDCRQLTDVLSTVRTAIAGDIK